MAFESIRVSSTLPTDPARIYQAWLDSGLHSAFTGGKAQIDPRVGGRFTTWDGYIEGTTLELEPNRRIVQSWKSSDFPQYSGFSRIEVILTPLNGATELTVIHTDIPEGLGDKFRQGWKEHYFDPMQRYFKGPATATDYQTESLSDNTIYVHDFTAGDTDVGTSMKPKTKAKKPAKKAAKKAAPTKAKAKKQKTKPTKAAKEKPGKKAPKAKKVANKTKKSVKKKAVRRKK